MPSTHPEGRREFLGQIAATALASAGALAVPATLHAAAFADAADPDHWLDGLKGKHKQVVDAYVANDGWPLGFVHNYLATATPAGSSAAVLVLRHFAFPIAVDDSIWSKYKVGESLKIMDPATGKPATKNPFLRPAKGVLLADDMAIDRLIARGVPVGGCTVALTVLSGKLAGNAGVSAAAAKDEWEKAVLPGVTMLPSGVWGVNRAQEKGCTYCTGGG